VTFIKIVPQRDTWFNETKFIYLFYLLFITIMLQASRKLDSVRCFGNSKILIRLYHIDQHIRRHVARPRISTIVNSAAALQQQQQRSISIIPTVVRVAFSAARLPIFIAGTAVAGATVASNKFQGK
jgi:hypothetical protein